LPDPDSAGSGGNLSDKKKSTGPRPGQRVFNVRSRSRHHRQWTSVFLPLWAT